MASEMRYNLITKQTDEKGLPVNQVYIESGTSIQSEPYLSLLVDRTKVMDIHCIIRRWS